LQSLDEFVEVATNVDVKTDKLRRIDYRHRLQFEGFENSAGVNFNNILHAAFCVKADLLLSK